MTLQTVYKSSRGSAASRFRSRKPALQLWLPLRISLAIVLPCAILCFLARSAGATVLDTGIIAFSSPLNAGGASWRIVLFDVHSNQTIDLWGYQGLVPAQLVWSPDGMQIAASILESGEIYVLDVYDRSGHRLVEEDGARSFPAWSPDGTQILFQQNDDPFGSSPRIQIYQVNRDGGSLRQLTNDASMHPAWLPDGGQFVYSTFNGGDLYLMTQDGNEQHLLMDNATRNTHPVWSPDGSQIAFLGYSYSGDVGDWIYVADADGSDAYRLAADTKMEGRPWWSPDGQQIAFVGQLNGDTYDSIFVADLNGGLRRLADHVEYAYDMLWSLWSPDGRYIAFEPSNADGLSIVEVATGQVTRLTDVRSSYPSWRPE